jgi:HK97 family phage portal protein
MRIIDRAAAALGYQKAVVAGVPNWLSATGRAERWSIPELRLPEKQAELYQRLSWVAAAVSHTAQQAAGVKFHVEQLVGETSQAITNHPFELLLRRPNPSMSRFELLEATFAYRQLTGNGYWWLNRSDEFAAPSEIWALPAHKVQPVPDGNLYLRGYMYDPGDGREIPLEPWEVVHFRRFHPLNSYVGLSPIEALATVAIGDMKMQEWNTNFFGRDNAKMPGLLAFADPISAPDWQKIKDDVTSQHGGTKRALMMLRSVGKGGVQWVSTSMSQKDMEFLSARRFNKEEIFQLFAPGLASMLDVNATEANSEAGRQTFMNLAVWPLHQTVGEKITNDILPAYGDDLVGSFEDVRPENRELKLQEQAAFERSHTIGEVRREMYGHDPLGDDRDGKLFAELKASPDASGSGLDYGGDETGEFEAKADERRKFRRFAQKRLDEGKPERIAKFRFAYLGVAEADAMRAEFVPESQPDNGYAELVAEIKATRKALEREPLEMAGADKQ